METKNIVITAVIVVLLAALGFAYYFELGVNDFESCAERYTVAYIYPATCETYFGKHFVQGENGQVIGGDRDEHGCLGPAGFSWNEEEQECVREWEEGEARYQVIDFTTCADAGYAVGESYPRQCWTPSGRHFVEGQGIDINQYFREEMWRRGVENLNGAHPIEGFDPQMFIGAYPGLRGDDFDGASAIGGHWEIENGELKFVAAEDGVITSADGTINEEGMKTVLINLAERVGADIVTEEGIDRLIDSLTSGTAKYEGGLILMQNKDSGEYSCFGCNGVMCVDPAPVMRMVQETDERYCDGDFNVVEESGASEMLRYCPDEWFENRMPTSNDDETGAPAMSNQYFIVDGERRELIEFDVDFVKKYCDIQKQVVY